MKEYNYLKGEVAIETKYTEKGETYKVYYENKEYLFGLFSVKGRKIENGIIIYEYNDDDFTKTIVKNKRNFVSRCLFSSLWSQNIGKRKTLNFLRAYFWVEDRIRTGDLLNHNQAF